MSGRRRATLNDLAAALGLSANTVSRALAQKDGVSAQTRELVLREAERIGYRIPSPPRRRTESRTVGLVVTSSTNVFTAQLIPAVESALRAVGYSIALWITEENHEVEEAAIKAITKADLAGAIVIPVQGDDDPWGRVGTLPFPVVAVAREISSLDCDFVAADARAAMYAATRHVLTNGAESLLFFEEDLEAATIQARIDGFYAALTTQPGAASEVVRIPTRRFESRVVPWQPEEAYRSVLEVLHSGIAFDTMLFSDDYYVLGALRALREHGRRVPEDVRIVGYGDHPYAPYLTPSLTTISLPSRHIAEVAVSMLLQRIAGDQGSTIHRLLPAELVIRESSVRPRRGPTRPRTASGRSGRASRDAAPQAR